MRHFGATRGHVVRHALWATPNGIPREAGASVVIGDLMAQVGAVGAPRDSSWRSPRDGCLRENGPIWSRARYGEPATYRHHEGRGSTWVMY